MMLRVFEIVSILIPLAQDRSCENIACLFEVGDVLTPYKYLITVVGIIVVFVIIPLTNKLFSKLYKSIEGWCMKRSQVVRINRLEFVLPSQLLNWIPLLLRYFRSAILLVILFVGISLLMTMFPTTRGYALLLNEKLIHVFGVFWAKILGFIPNILALIVITLVSYYSLKFIRFFSDGIKYGKIKVFGVHPDLIDPTLQLLRFLIIILALVVSYSFIPGSDSPVFRGVSIFIGFLLSMGSTSVVANIFSGIVLIYTRGLKVGDRVQIADTVGDVVERNLLVTRVRTIKNVVITIPNGMVLNNHIINYSVSSQANGLILNTTVTIGYDVPWRYVYQLLNQAAHNTRGVLDEPAPFVHQTSLDDSYVSYELNAYTKEPARMDRVYSELHQNIQDEFNQAGVEILSPVYSAWRDGSATTNPIPRHNMANVFNVLSPEDTRPIRR